MPQPSLRSVRKLHLKFHSNLLGANVLKHDKHNYFHHIHWHFSHPKKRRVLPVTRPSNAKPHHRLKHRKGKHIVRYRYNAVKVLKNFHNRHPIAHPCIQDLRCLLWVQTVIYVLPEFLYCFVIWFVGMHYNSAWPYIEFLTDWIMQIQDKFF